MLALRTSETLRTYLRSMTGAKQSLKSLIYVAGANLAAVLHIFKNMAFGALTSFMLDNDRER